MAQRSVASFAIRRLVTVVPVLFGVVVVVFLLTRLLPGDPAVFFASTPGAGAREIEEVRHRLGLDLSLPQQFLIYVKALAHGDLGQSILTGRSVADDLAHRLPASLELTVAALVVAAGLALPLGILAAIRPGSLVDHACRVIGTAGLSMPIFVTGLLLIYFFYYLLGWAPDPVGRLDPFLRAPPVVTGSIVLDSILAGDPELVWSSLSHLALPTIAMALFSLAPLARMTRASMVAALGSDFVRTARALGLPRPVILLKYALRSALLPVVTTLGMVFSYMLGANVLVEKVFSWPGVGSYALKAMTSLDYAPLQGFVLLMATIYVVLNLCIDILYGLIDPRVDLAG